MKQEHDEDGFLPKKKKGDDDGGKGIVHDDGAADGQAVLPPAAVGRAADQLQ